MVASLEGVARMAGRYEVTKVTTVVRRTDGLEVTAEKRGWGRMATRWAGAEEVGAEVAVVEVPGRGWRVGGEDMDLGVWRFPESATMVSWEDGGVRNRFRAAEEGLEGEAEDGVKVSREGGLEVRRRQVIKEEGVTWVAGSTVLGRRVE